MNVSVHMGRRYCQRIKGIEEKTSGSYYLQNMEQIDLEILKLFEYSELFYSGKIRQHATRSYFKHRNIILVSTEDTLVSIFRISFGGISEEKAESILSIMLDEVEEVVESVTKIEQEVSDQIEVFDSEIDGAKANIERLKKQIEAEEAHISANKEYKKVVRQKAIEGSWKLNDLMEAIIGKGFAGEIQ